MPSEKILEQKKRIVADLAAQLKVACAGVLVDYRGVTVDDDTKLRRELRGAGIHYAVIKNTLLTRAVEDAGLTELQQQLTGTTALALSDDDHVAAARVLCGFAEKHEKFKVKAGFIDGQVIDDKEVVNLSQLPAREVLVAQVLGGLNAPIAGFANVLNGTLRGLVCALSAIAEKQSA